MANFEAQPKASILPVSILPRTHRNGYLRDMAYTTYISRINNVFGRINTK